MYVFKAFCGYRSLSLVVWKSLINTGEKNGGDDKALARDLCCGSVEE